ncbi:methionine ABC transporter ATP-binding protein [Chitinivorax sp. B]|uniref:methionine ABC transporter ATP-binding protein n=1 Tax=Chitinivorax sp. B TaxID=2502235 RepID=UPI0010F4D66D|nr:methionine ABC transporter ATP-binding protein [Chitinivorax sp. B]
MIRISRVSKSYQVDGKPLPALKDISLDINQGEVFGIIGRSGAGKSTLIRTLNLLERPNSGAVEIDGIDITHLDDQALRTLRQQIGMVFQHFNLLSSKTVADNVAFPLKLAGKLGVAEHAARVTELLALVGLLEHRNKYPSQLSGGQKQRVGIARALACQPKLLLCDEATSALDPQTTRSILQLLLDINRKLGLTIVLITHEMNVIRTICDRVAVIEAGQIVESGPVVDVFLHPRHAATRSMVAESSHFDELEQAFDVNQPRGKLIKLSFMGENTYQPVIDHVAKTHAVKVNLLQGTIGRIKDTPYGQLIVELQGAADDVAAAHAAFAAHQVHVEVV